MLKLLLTLILSLILNPFVIAEEGDLEYFDEALTKVKKKTIYEAYFHLDANQVPLSIIFFPDTKGNAYAVIVKKDVYEDQPPHIFYNEDSWKALLASTEKWQVPNKEALKNTWAKHVMDYTSAIDSEYLSLKVPSDHKEFIDGLLSAWKIPKKDFKLKSIGWN